MNEINNLELVDFHDAKLGIILCNYDQHKVIINFFLENSNYLNKKVDMYFIDVDKLEVNILEPWGAGMYVNEILIEEKDNLKTKILLNSGDEILVSSKNIYSKVAL